MRVAQVVDGVECRVNVGAGAGDDRDIRMREAAEGFERLVRGLGSVRRDGILGLLIVCSGSLGCVDNLLCPREMVPRVDWQEGAFSIGVSSDRCVRSLSPPSRTTPPPATPDAKLEDEEGFGGELEAEDDWVLWKVLVPPMRHTVGGRPRRARLPALRVIMNTDIVVARRVRCSWFYAEIRVFLEGLMWLRCVGDDTAGHIHTQ